MKQTTINPQVAEQLQAAFGSPQALLDRLDPRTEGNADVMGQVARNYREELENFMGSSMAAPTLRTLTAWCTVKGVVRVLVAMIQETAVALGDTAPNVKEAISVAEGLCYDSRTSMLRIATLMQYLQRIHWRNGGKLYGKGPGAIGEAIYTYIADLRADETEALEKNGRNRPTEQAAVSADAISFERYAINHGLDPFLSPAENLELSTVDPWDGLTREQWCERNRQQYANELNQLYDRDR